MAPTDLIRSGPTGVRLPQQRWNAPVTCTPAAADRVYVRARRRATDEPPAAAARPWRAASPDGGRGTIAGGLLYTAGGVVYGLRRPDPSPCWFGFHEVFHEVFHALAIAAFTAHYTAVLLAAT